MATLVIACPICLQKIRAPANVVGRQIRCPQCKNGFTAADPAAVPTEPVAPIAPRPPVSAVENDAPPAADPLGLDSDEAPPGAAGGSSAFVDFLMLRRSITPSILVGLFWFGVVVVLLIGLVGGIVTLVNMATRAAPVGIGLLTILLDFVISVSALIIWRVICEALATLFRLSEQIREMNERGR